MSTYEILDVIADAYNPILLVVLLLFISRAIYQRRWVEVEMLFSSSVVGLGFVYLIMFVDNNLSIWGSIGLDYSTHTAFAISIVTVLIIISKSYSKLLFVSLVFYIMLELYQKYHSIMVLIAFLSWLKFSDYFKQAKNFSIYFEQKEEVALLQLICMGFLRHEQESLNNY